MGWQDDPIVSSAGSWQNDPIVVPPPSALRNPLPVEADDAWYTRAAKNTINGPAALAGAMFDAAKGPTPDPKYQDLSSIFNTFNNEGMGTAPVGAAKMFATSDAQYADVIQQMLGKRFLGRTKDANGADVFEFIDKSGKPKKAYVNKPGLDFEDIDRAAGQVMQALPAGRAATALNGARAGLVRAGLTQAALQGGNSLAKDAIASQMGSQQGLDFNRAMWEAAGAFGGELVARGLGKVVQQYKINNLFDNGKLTAEGEQLAQAYGIDPTDLTTEYQKQFARDVIQAEDPTAAARKVALESRGIQPTTGMVTRNNEDLLLEEDILRGALDTNAVKRSEILSNSRLSPMTLQRRGQPATTLDEQFSLSRRMMLEDKVGQPAPSKPELGDKIKSSVDTIHQTEKQAVSDAWDKVNPIYPDKMDLLMLKTRVKGLEKTEPRLFNRLKHLDPQTQSNALAVRDQMEKLVKGKLKSKGSSLYGKAEQIDLDTFRRRLADFRNRAFNAEGGGSDYKAVTDQIDIFNDYLDDMANGANVQDAVQLLKARDLSKKFKAKFGTTGDPSKDPGGRFIQDLLERRDATPEHIVDSLLTHKEALASFRKIQDILGKNSDDIKMMKAYAFERNFTDAKGIHFTPEIATKNLETFLDSSLGKEMFTPMDITILKKYANQTRSLTVPKAVRGKGSALAQSLARAKKDGIIRYLLQRRGQSATFQSKPMESVFFQTLARSKVATPLWSLRDSAADRVLNNLMKAKIPKKKAVAFPSGFGAMGATVGSRAPGDD